MKKTTIARAIPGALLATTIFLLALPHGSAQEAAPAASTRNMERGQDQLQANDVHAVDTLRAAAQDSLNEVAEVSASKAPHEQMDDAREHAAEAHLLWATAADHFLRRDEAIAAYSRAISLALGPKPDEGGVVAPRVARDARSSVSALLRAGLPQQAPDDVMDTLARNVQGGLWTPRHFSFTPPAAIAAPGAPAPGPLEFLVTDGKLFPPELPNPAPGMSRLARVAPLYRMLAPDSLPASLKMDRVLYGYARETSGPNRGLWKQVARVFYASDYLTRDNRDDRPRATILCEQFLRTWALSRAALGLENPYAADGVTTMWLIEVSSWWPQDDDDPIVAAQLPPRMPDPNTPLNPRDRITGPVTSSPLSRPWRASAQMDSAPGEILFFKAGYARDEAEWLRQLTHEYGHVTLPQFDGFAPPMEPLGNGALGETLAALWISSDPAGWAPSEGALQALKKSVPAPPTADDDAAPVPPTFVPFDRTAFASSLDRHTALNALAAFQAWKSSGPNSPVARENDRDGLRYLCGAALYIERVYGAPALGAALRALNAQRKTAPRSTDLLGAFAGTQSAAPTQTLWLGGALDGVAEDAISLRERAPAALRQGQSLKAWLYVPPGVRGLRVFYTGAGNRTPPRLSSSERPGVTRQEKNGYSSLISVAARGWVQFSFQASAPVSVGMAQWEK